MWSFYLHVRSQNVYNCWMRDLLSCVNNGNIAQVQLIYTCVVKKKRTSKLLIKEQTNCSVIYYIKDSLLVNPKCCIILELSLRLVRVGSFRLEEGSQPGLEEGRQPELEEDMPPGVGEGMWGMQLEGR